MSELTKGAVEKAIAGYLDPYLQKNLVELGWISDIKIDQGQVIVELTYPYPNQGLQGAIRQMLSLAVEDIDGVTDCTIKIDTKVVAQKTANNIAALAQVKNIIAVASGKGGVGKSTVSVNLALSLAEEGAKAGVLDADIYGPSIGMMLGVKEGIRPDVVNEKLFVPVVAHGLQTMTMAYLVTDETPMVWRGPMVSGALQQLLKQTHWQQLDYLIVDMPPGTGDIQLTLAQKVPVTGAVMVTTPQDIALLDCKKGIEMFRKVNIPVLGIVENMSTYCCPNCGHQEPVFGEGGGERIAAQYNTDLIGQLPLNRTIREQTDSGNPTVISAPDSEIALIYRDMARKVTAELAARVAEDALATPDIIIRS
ncbi:MAG: iron-sulfur cluster carrier protein ApbC [Gammaproteobacteria bacterium]|nr:MAG: iron-sulfur cluster carrier protein ApbC [Gammaproteobacteria bacterium]